MSNRIRYGRRSHPVGFQGGLYKRCKRRANARCSFQTCGYSSVSRPERRPKACIGSFGCPQPRPMASRKRMCSSILDVAPSIVRCGRTGLEKLGEQIEYAFMSDILFRLVAKHERGSRSVIQCEPSRIEPFIIYPSSDLPRREQIRGSQWPHHGNVALTDRKPEHYVTILSCECQDSVSRRFTAQARASPRRPITTAFSLLPQIGLFLAQAAPNVRGSRSGPSFENNVIRKN